MNPDLPYNPLNQKHCDACSKVLASIPQALQLCDAAEECGWDVQQFRETLLQQQKQAAATKARFFPREH